jgi:hypothetical protein
MSPRLNVIKVGSVLAAVLAGFHLLWSLLVATGWAQPVIDFIFWAHFIRPSYVIEPFQFARAFALLGINAASGFILGALFSWLWNVLHKS